MTKPKEPKAERAKPVWCKCEGHEHEGKHSQCCWFEGKSLPCPCKPPAMPMKFSEVFEKEKKKYVHRNPNRLSLLNSVVVGDLLAKTLDRFLPEIEVPSEEGEDE